MYIDIYNTDNDTVKTMKYMETRETDKIKTQIYIYMYIILATIQWKRWKMTANWGLYCLSLFIIFFLF